MHVIYSRPCIDMQSDRTIYNDILNLYVICNWPHGRQICKPLRKQSNNTSTGDNSHVQVGIGGYWKLLLRPIIEPINKCVPSSGDGL
jgi:hypothetical protein